LNSIDLLVYGKGEDAELHDDWDSCYPDMDSSETEMIPKSEPYDEIYDEENYSESSNIE
jgi:hypothetical protein